MIAKRKRKTTDKKTTVGDVKSTPTGSSSCDNSRIPVEETGDSSEGCRKCGLDNDHSHLLLCESCNDEYHTYCLDPPLQYVPEGDFFCGEFYFYRKLVVTVSVLASFNSTYFLICFNYCIYTCR